MQEFQPKSYKKARKSITIDNSSVLDSNLLEY